MRPPALASGAVWNWGPLYVDIVKTVVGGDFVGSKYNANFRVGYKTGTNPFVLASYGGQITEATKKKITDAEAWLATDEGSPFAGPVEDQSGNVVIKDGVIPTYAENDAMGFFVKGVIGKLAQ